MFFYWFKLVVECWIFFILFVYICFSDGNDYIVIFCIWRVEGDGSFDEVDSIVLKKMVEKYFLFIDVVILVYLVLNCLEIEVRK